MGFGFWSGKWNKLIPFFIFYFLIVSLHFSLYISHCFSFFFVAIEFTYRGWFPRMKISRRIQNISRDSSEFKWIFFVCFNFLFLYWPMIKSVANTYLLGRLGYRPKDKLKRDENWKSLEIFHMRLFCLVGSWGI